jgi:hypothetical protein
MTALPKRGRRSSKRKSVPARSRPVVLAKDGADAERSLARVDAIARRDPDPQRADERVTLTADERVLLAEAIRRGEQARDAMESAAVAFGRWLLIEVFRGDATAALEGGERVRVWRALLEAADGYRLRLDKRTLSVSLRIAAYDERLQDDVWRLLDAGRKALLLPLEDPALLKQAARHVTTMRLTLAATAQYVANLRRELGAPPALRMTPERALRAVHKLGEPFADPRWVKQLGSRLKELPREGREEALDELRAARDAIAALIAQLR